MLPHPYHPIPSGRTPDRPSRANRSGRSRLYRTRAMSLPEVVFASVILAMVLLGTLQGMLQSRRQTEGSVRQASVASLVQGYLEQLKSIKYGDLPLSPATAPATGTTATDKATWVAANASVSLIDSAQNSTVFYLAPGTPPTSLDGISGLSTTNLSLHTEQVDIDNINSASENSTLNMWVWILDQTDSTRPNVVDCRSIVIAYTWTLRDGGRVRVLSDMTRTIRSSVPTD